MPPHKGGYVPVPVPVPVPGAGKKQRTPVRKVLALLLIPTSVLFLLFSFRANILAFGARCIRPQSIEGRVAQILSHTPLIGEPPQWPSKRVSDPWAWADRRPKQKDGHNDLAILLRGRYDNHIYGPKFKKQFEEGGLVGHVDLPRLRAGMNGGFFWSVFWICPNNASDYSTKNYASSTMRLLPPCCP